MKKVSFSCNCCRLGLRSVIWRRSSFLASRNVRPVCCRLVSVETQGAKSLCSFKPGILYYKSCSVSVGIGAKKSFFTYTTCLDEYAQSPLVIIHHAKESFVRTFVVFVFTKSTNHRGKVFCLAYSAFTPRKIEANGALVSDFFKFTPPFFTPPQVRIATALVELPTSY